MLDRAATLIAAARLARTPLAALPAGIVPGDERDGYRVQQAVHTILADDAGRRIGWKIGCTSAVMQNYLGIPHPCAGGVFAGGVHDSGVSLRHRDYVHVGVECEIAVRLGRDVVAADAASVADAIEAYLPAIEIVDDRYADWRSLGAPTLIADDFFAAGCVLGAPVPRAQAPDLLAVTGRAVLNGVEVAHGSGADVLGHPHHALAWLASHLAEQGQQLRAGEIVLTGSLVQTLWLNPGDAAVMQLSGLGEVAVRFD
ncbi:fumarylacetoacetate hydrolase family protein [Tardiphaga sp.]|uniref:2-keto-4-pentenoate hydratase n=1 Tax=Tardiphaga sp. TaxID=1926292 RepID=UPI002617BF1E|nr:fumarylacetoacetate hydrolase family protein [Tardiphaga sp.]MDB5618683.1 2-oxo-3-hexenedioate decarboxylase/2-keto-4-pentenoate hydratase [Tardiphaga sp.]